jgi:hypothetical protein
LFFYQCVLNYLNAEWISLKTSWLVIKCVVK